MNLHRPVLFARREYYRRTGVNTPAYVFHHIPKAAGTSLVRALSRILYVVRDYRQPWSSSYPDAHDLSRFVRNDCLCGHFELEGYRIRERYPQVFATQDYRVFTFLRDPLASAVSLHKYLRANHQEPGGLNDFLGRVNNRVSRIMMLSHDDFEERLADYFFVGMVEHAQASFDAFCTQIGTSPFQLPTLNRSRNRATPEGGTPARDVIEEFRERNALDYSVYAAAKQRFYRTVGQVSNPC